MKAQFLSYSYENKASSLFAGYYDNYFRFNDSQDGINSNEIIKFEKKIPGLSYRNDNLLLSALYNNFKYEGKKTEYISLDAYYKMSIPLSGSSSLITASIPLLLRTSYYNIIQENNSLRNRFENGNFGLGTGLNLFKSFDWVDINFLYNYCIGYSTINFSIDYGYMVQNEIALYFNFNEISDDYGICFGCKYADHKWKISEKKYNYYHSDYGLFIGINF